jgi:hypothetical protein
MTKMTVRISSRDDRLFRIEGRRSRDMSPFMARD